MEENSYSMHFGVSRKQESLLWDRSNFLTEKLPRKNLHIINIIMSLAGGGGWNLKEKG